MMDPYKLVVPSKQRSRRLYKLVCLLERACGAKKVWLAHRRGAAAPTWAPRVERGGRVVRHVAPKLPTPTGNQNAAAAPRRKQRRREQAWQRPWAEAEARPRSHGGLREQQRRQA